MRHCAGVLAAGFPLVAFLQLVRVYVQSMRRIADAEVRLFHLYVHEPLIRDAVPELEMAEEIGELAGDILPMAAPLTEYLHARYLRFFLEQDVVGHMESELGASGSQVHHVPVTLCFIDLTGFTRYTEEEGDLEALDVVENFVRTVESTLPPEATVVKTIGDEVMVVSPDPGSLTEWAVGLLDRFPERPQPRVGIHYAQAVYRDGDYFGTHVNLAHRVVGRALAGEVMVTDAVAESLGERGLVLHADRRGHASRASPSRPSSSWSGPNERHARGGSGGGPAARRGPRWWRCSPAAATRSACSTSSPGCSGSRRSPRSTSTTGSATTPTRTSDSASGYVSGSGSSSRSSTRAAPRGSGNLQAWARDARYAAAARLALEGDDLIATGHTADDQVETILYRLASSPEPPRPARDATR